MNQDFSELIQYLDEKFGKTTTKEEMQTLSARLIGLQEDVRAMRVEFSDLRDTIDRLVNAIDGFAKIIDDLRTEYAAIAMQLSRHEKWIQQVAQKLGIRLEY